MDNTVFITARRGGREYISMERAETERSANIRVLLINLFASYFGVTAEVFRDVDRAKEAAINTNTATTTGGLDSAVHDKRAPAYTVYYNW